MSGMLAPQMTTRLVARKTSIGDDDEDKKPVYENTNGMPLANGKNLHMDVGPGDIANRIITVGSESRAIKISHHLDSDPAPKRISSSRGFTTITGKYKGCEVSIVSIGMVSIGS